MSYTADDLYALLPAAYRLRDAETGYALRGLVSVLAEQADVMDADIAALYENWFIETSDRWAVAYIGDLLRVGTLATTAFEGERGLSALPRRFSQRAYVANAIAYRRRKGTASVLEQLAVDVTGWRASAVEFFQLLATTQYTKHVRPLNVAVPDLRAATQVAAIGGAFDRTSHTAEIRSPVLDDGSGRRRTPVEQGRYNIPNVGLFVWRLQPYRVTSGTPRSAGPPAGGGFTFSPLGVDGRLFNPPRTEREMSHLARQPDVPVPLERRILFDELEGRRQATVDGAPHPGDGFFRDDGVPFAIRYSTTATPDTFTEVPPERVSICDLSAWGRPAATRPYSPRRGGPDETLPVDVGVDPVLGRLAFAQGVEPDEVRVDYCYAFSGDLGGGPYDRRDATELWFEPAELTFQIGVTKDGPTLDTSTTSEPLVATLAEAVARWHDHVAGRERAYGLIVVIDSASYEEDLSGVATIQVPAGARLAIAAADWPGELDALTGGAPTRTTGRIATDKPLRPHLRGDLRVHGTATAAAENPGALILSGLLVDGALTVNAGNLGRLTLFDCTVVPGQGGIVVEPGSGPAADNGSLAISLDRSICGPLSVPETVRSIHLGDAIVDAAVAAAAITAPGARADIQQATVLGEVAVERLEAGNSIFTAAVTATRRQDGCVRFAHVPVGSSTPRRFRCQPDLALTGVTDPDTARRVEAELRPAFGSTDYGDPDYCQLTVACAREVRTGAEDGSEMGAFSSLKQPQREANLRLALGEYLRSGLDAGIFFAT